MVVEKLNFDFNAPTTKFQCQSSNFFALVLTRVWDQNPVEGEPTKKNPNKVAPVFEDKECVLGVSNTQTNMHLFMYVLNVYISGF